MLKKTIKFEDLDGNERSEDFYFNMKKTELTELGLKNGGFERILEDLGKAQSALEGYQLFKEVVLMSYGVKGEDGVTFEKQDANGKPLSEKFEQHPAFDELIIELLQDEQGALEFIQGLFPAKHREEIAKAVAEHEAAKNKDEAQDTTPLTPVAPLEAVAPVLDAKKFEDYSEEALQAMSREEFDALLPKNGQMTQPMLQIAMKRRLAGK